MNADDFRRIAFVTLHPHDLTGMVKLAPDQQQTLMRDYPGAFAPEAGASGRSGCTRVRLDLVDEETLGGAITLAWQNSARKSSRGPKRRKTS